MDKPTANSGGLPAEELADRNRLLIKEFGNEVVNMPSAFEMKILLPIDEESIDRAVAGLENITLETLQGIGEISSRIELLNEHNKSNEDISLAARSFSHDSRGVYNIVQGGVSLNHRRLLEEKVRTLEEMPRVRQKGTFLNGLYSDLEHFRLIALSIAYLASGGTDKKFLVSTQSSQLEYLLGRRRTNAFDLDGRGRNRFEDGLIPSTVYASANQLAKNAKSNYRMGFSISKQGPEEYGVLRIKDRGPGLQDRDGEPLPPERFYEIFGSFTTKEKGGLGLQIAKRLIELSGGWIEVTSRAKDGNVYRYSTRTQKVEPLGLMDYRGTEFNLYFPKAA